MSRVDTLAAHSALDFNHAHTTYPHFQPHYEASRVAPAAYDDPGETIFPDLPPLHAGHPEVHLRRGVMRAAALAAEHVPDAEKAFFVGDLAEVYRQHMRWRKALPEVQPFYAVKCNPDPYILRLLASLGAGFDCASHNEIGQVLAIGPISPDNIIFANPCKAISFIRSAAARGVRTMTFDNADELHKIARAHPSARCVVRILTDDSKSLCAFGIKFGAPLDTVPGLLATAKRLGVDVVGVSFHVGSGCYDPGVYADALARARAVWDMGAAAGYTFDLLDVGGGFEDERFEHAASVITDSIERYFPDRRGIRIIAEPGRFYVSNAFRLAACIIARRAPIAGGPQEEEGEMEMAAEEEKEGENEAGDRPDVMYYINDGVYGAFNCILFDHQVITPQVLCMGGSFHIPSSSSASAMHTASVWGPTCDSIDCVAPRAVLPRGLAVGDWMRFEKMGAYTVCAASAFNGFEVSRVVYTVGGPGAAEAKAALVRFARGEA